MLNFSYQLPGAGFWGLNFDHSNNQSGSPNFLPGNRKLATGNYYFSSQAKLKR
ncbi:hypothetical protein [Niastella vici]|uniref:hypothetical protein n=1 Tax=Niastella vici TaxID=1703345 RepID=UPI001C1F4D6F|nr:hypothetical protein [Niastella vici]